MLLLDQAKSRLLLYNESAGQVWQAATRGASASEIAGELAAVHGISPSSAVAAVTDTLDHWRAEGLFPTCYVDDNRRQVRPCGAPSRADFSWEAGFRFGGKRFVLAVEAGARAETIRPLFEQLSADSPGGGNRIEVVEAPGGAASIFVDGVHRLTTTDPGLLVGAVHHAMLDHIYATAEWLALIHGGAVALDGRAIGLPARSGSGKSTLIAALEADGLTYLADDLLAVMPGGQAAPWPMPISIKQASWAVVGSLRSDLSQARSYRTKDMDALLLPPRPDAWSLPPIPLAALVFPAYSKGAPAELRKLTQLETMHRLLSDRIWLGHPLQEEAVRSFLRWVEQTPAYSLRYSSIADGIATVRSLLAE